MRRGWIVLALLGACGCATPAHVKQAIKLQSEAYVELQGALQDFAQNYGQLREHLSHLEQEANARNEARKVIVGLSKRETNKEDIKELAKRLDTASPNSEESFMAFRQSIDTIKDACCRIQTQDGQPSEKLQQPQTPGEAAIMHAAGQVRGLVVIHEAVGAYLDIDLAPKPETLKEAISSVKALEK